MDESRDDQDRKTFLNSENADYSFMKQLESGLLECGFRRHETSLRAFLNGSTGEFLEIEVGGPETSGHYLHYFQAE